MKRRQMAIAVWVLLAVWSAALTGVAGIGDEEPAAPAATCGCAAEGGACAGQGAGGGCGGCGQGGAGGCQATLAEMAAKGEAAALTDAERKGLLTMREEEKLARDLYQELGKRFSLPIFTNIRGAEVRHMAAVGTLLEMHKLDDPAAGKDEGRFQDPAIQKTYDSLLARGSASLEAALAVAAEFEELDIRDLERFAGQTEKEDIQFVYGNLQRASRNHLRAFTGQLQHRGAPYTPKHLTRATYDEIVGATHEPGGHGRQMRRGWGRGGGAGHGQPAGGGE